MRPFKNSTSRRGLAAAAWLAAGLAGCSGGLGRADRGDALRIATSWPRDDRARLAQGFAGWLREHPAEAVGDAVAIAWVETSDDEPTADALRRLDPAPDVLLGGPVADFARLAVGERLESLGDGAPRPYWVVARRTAVGLLDATAPAARLALADPRVDPATLAWCLGRTEEGGWRAGYAALVDLYGSADVAAGWRGTSARAAVDRGRAERSVVRLAATAASSVVYEEAAAIPRGALRAKAARAFLKFLVADQGARTGPEFEAASAAGGAADLEGLAADLLGATLVDARDELATAVAAVRKAGSPDWAVQRLTQPPPWPPASIEKLLRKEGEAGLTLVETLTGQVAPEPSLRLWLAQSWLKPSRDLDRAVLAEVAAVERGRLVREPRFRAWLRAEWTQWARQRYRWVARLAASGATPSVPPPVPSES
ncbi:hypothetical protein [Paludisphaera mucosa]|uniref:Uncharacterized protein n=1 Tax=Paludisphaera mucosa TaxID=3030827 RepID=A0ABT6FGC1_9BACT|nr:hypothetical protein [Paludisphaera mucosa]MDG3006551.1 hypothetical protein [Paludisphaera mucosa]